MVTHLFAQLPDDTLEWTGTAAELADKVNELAPQVGLDIKPGKLNERLVRHYAQLKILTPPRRSGREALFSGKAILEIIIARHLLADGWPLGKVARIMPSLSFPEPGRTETPAQHAIAKIRQSPAGRKRPTDREDNLEPEVAEGVASTARESIAKLSLAGSEVASAIQLLGGGPSEPAIETITRIRLTSWCEVLIDFEQFRSSGSEASAILGEALKLALEKERRGLGGPQ